MKTNCLLLFCCFPLFMFSQEVDNVISLDSITVKLETLPKTERDTYIKDHTKQLNIKLEVSNDIQEYYIPFESKSVKIEPNLGLRYAAVFSYKFLSVRLGFRPKPSSDSKEDKGDPNSFRIRFQLLFERWSHNFEYNHVKGYYITGSDSFLGNTSDYHLQFPELTTNVFFGSTGYKFNKNYSIRATHSQTEIQLKSAGSFVPNVDYWFYNFDGLDKYINGNGEEIIRTNYIDAKGVDIIINAGYHYTFVHKHWYANIFANPGIGIDFNKTTSYSQSIKSSKNHNDLVLSFQAGTGVGYNAEKIFFGAAFEKKITNEKFNPNKIQFHTSKNTFFIFFGYRFKAPKVISKPIDEIEEKIPMLKKG